MRTAVFYSGQARTFASCFANQYHYVLRHFPDPSFFVSVADDAQAGSMELLRRRFGDVVLESAEQPIFAEAQKWAADAPHGGFPCSAAPQNIMRAFWGYRKVFGMCAEPLQYDLFVRIRPDIWFQEFEPPAEMLGEGVGAQLCLTPPWGSYGGINDRFAVLGRIAAQKYFHAFDHIRELLDAGCPFHPETLTRAALERGGAVRPMQRLVADFKIRRMASHRHPQFNPNGDREWLVPEPILGIELLRASITR